MRARRGQESLSTNYLTTGIIVALVLAVVIIAAVRSEIVQKLREMPGGEEEVEEGTITGGCVIKPGYTMKSNSCGGNTCLFVTTNVQTGTSYPTTIYIKNNKIFVYNEGEEVQVGIIVNTTTAGRNYLRFYCDAKNIFPNLGALYDTFGSSYYQSKISASGKTILCDDNLSTDIFALCSGGEEIKNRLLSKIITMDLKSMKRDGNELIRLKGDVYAKESANFRVISFPHPMITEEIPYYLNYPLFSDFPPEEFDSSKHDVNLELVWDECAQKPFVVSYFNALMPNGDLIEYFSRTSIQDKQTLSLPKLIFDNFFVNPPLRFTQVTRDRLSLNLTYVLSSTSRDDFTKRLANFVIASCMIAYSGKDQPAGWDTKWQGGLKTGNCEDISCETAFCESFHMTLTQAMGIINSTFVDPALNYKCGGYECLLDKAWQECKFSNGKFCSLTDAKKCIEYQWGDVFEFYNPNQKASVTYTLKNDYS